MSDSTSITQISFVIPNNYYSAVLSALHARLYSEKLFGSTDNPRLVIACVIPDPLGGLGGGDHQEWCTGWGTYAAQHLDPLTGWGITDVEAPWVNSNGTSNTNVVLVLTALTEGRMLCVLAQ